MKTKIVGMLAGLALACGDSNPIDNVLGPQLKNFPNQCGAVEVYGFSHSAGVANCAYIRKAVLLSREILWQAGLWAPAGPHGHDQSVSQFQLYVHDTFGWTDIWSRQISGETNRGTTSIEVNDDLSSLLHEEIHVMLGQDGDNHDNWDKLGYYGLDTYFSNQVGDGMAWNCATGRGMTRAMVDSLRDSGRPIDEFLIKHPDCLNKE